LKLEKPLQKREVDRVHFKEKSIFNDFVTFRLSKDCRWQSKRWPFLYPKSTLFLAKKELFYNAKEHLLQSGRWI